MAASCFEGIEDVKQLKTVFDEGEKIIWTLEYEGYKSNNLLQEAVFKAKGLLEDATKMVSALDIFSNNESLEDIPTPDIRYMLLPAYLGIVTLKLNNQDRKAVVNMSETYFKDFISRCKSYNIIDEKKADARLEFKSHGKVQNNLADLSRHREEKISRYKEQKEREQEIEKLKEYVEKSHVDDEVKRKYYVLIIEKWLDKSFEELDSLSLEKKFLEMRSSIPADRPEPPKSKSLKPIIITKNDIQKKVFGAGYPSIPTMTLDEFYEKSMKNGHMPDSIPSSNKKPINTDKKQDDDDCDNPEDLKKQRAMDDWKDDHKRGWGNRMNKS